MAGNVIVLTSEVLGDGPEELGRLLMKNFLYTLTGAEQLPSTLLFLNSGVKLLVEGAVTVESLLVLAERGVELLACGTCLDYYQLKDKLAVGQVSNMATIQEKMLQAENVINF